METKDIDEVARIERMCFSSPWSEEAFRREVTENEMAIYIVVEVDGTVRGYGGMWAVLNEGHITNIAVHPDFRRIHIGSSLIIGLFDGAERNNLDCLTLEVRESNIAAQKMYKRFGFKPEGIRKGYYQDNNENAIIMWTYFNNKS